MEKLMSALLALTLLVGCSSSIDPDQADQEPLPIQGELLSAAPVPASQVVSSGTGTVRERGDSATAAPGKAAQAAGIEELGPQSIGPSAADSLQEALESAAATTVQSASSGKDEGEYKFVAFDTLTGYEYFLTSHNESSLSQEPAKDQIPKHVRDLNDKKVVIEGYMVPIDVEGERIRSFILTNSMMMCCYGAMPWINEWIFVEMESEEGAGFYNDVVIRTKGVLEVGEEIEDGIVISLYRMKGHVVESTGEPIPFLFGN